MTTIGVKSIKIKIGDFSQELSLEEARQLKESLDELFPSKQTLPHFGVQVAPYQTWVPPSVDPFKPYCTAT